MSVQKAEVDGCRSTGRLFVEVRGRYEVYTVRRGGSHTPGIFVITELVRHSTAAADI